MFQINSADTKNRKLIESQGPFQIYEYEKI